MVALVLALLLLIPLVTTPLGGVIRNFDALAVESASLVLLGALVWRTKMRVDRESVQGFFQSGANLPIVLYAALGAVSCLWAGNKVYAGQETLRIVSGIILYFVVAYQFRRSEYLAKLVDILIALCMAVSIAGFVQHSQSTSEFAVGVFADHQLFGSFMMLLLPLAATIALTQKPGTRQIVAQCAAVLVAANLLISGCRSAWIGAAAGIVVLVLLAVYAMRKNLGRRIAHHKHEFIVPVVLLVTAIGFFLLVTPQTSSILMRANTLSDVKKQEGWIFRQQQWRGALEMVKARPLGFGIGQFPYEESRFTGNGVMLKLSKGRPSLGEMAHSFYLQTAAELGIPGLLLFLCIPGAFFVTGLRRLDDMEAGVRRQLLMGSMAAAAAFSVDACGSPSWQFGQVSMFFWAALGIGAACALPRTKGRVERSVTTESPGWFRPAATVGLIALICLLPTVVDSVQTSPLLQDAALTAAANPLTKPDGDACRLVYEQKDTAGNIVFSKDVTGQSVFSMTGGAGTLAPLPAPGNHVYTPRSHENDTAHITGTFQGLSGSLDLVINAP